MDWISMKQPLYSDLFRGFRSLHRNGATPVSGTVLNVMDVVGTQPARTEKHVEGLKGERHHDQRREEPTHGLPIDAGELDPDGDVEAQFLDWYQVREEAVPGEVHYKAILDAARVRKRAFEEGRRADLVEGAAKLGWDELASVPDLHRFMDHVRGAEN